MGKILLLDCTMRDGGYMNDWKFGENSIESMANLLTYSGVEIVELGFLRDEPSNKDRAVWNDINLTSQYIKRDNKDRKYAVMCELFNKFPLEKLSNRSESTPDIIRVIVWKRMIAEGVEYCKALMNKGYDVSIQPDRVNQYSQDEFKDMIEAFNEVKPYSMYIVDSNGLLCKREIMEYVKTADKYLHPSIKLGYHGHNNMLQALGAAESFIDMNLERDIIVDASVTGIGRSTGNLNTEIIAKYLNDNYDKEYDISKFIDVYSTSLRDIYNENPWGYSIDMFITAIYHCNPNYGAYLRDEYKLTATEIYKVVESLNSNDKIIFNKAAIPEYLEKLK